MALEARIELWCGGKSLYEKEDSTPAAISRYEKAEEVAVRLHVPTYFDVNREGGSIYTDAYLYPSVNQVVHLAEELDKAGVEFDNIDLPKGTPKRVVDTLFLRYPHGEGVSVNVDNWSPRNAQEKFESRSYRSRDMQERVDEMRGEG
jgi:hypothetical protein